MAMEVSHKIAHAGFAGLAQDRLYAPRIDAPQRNRHSLKQPAISLFALDQLFNGRFGKRPFTAQQNQPVIGSPHSSGRKAKPDRTTRLRQQTYRYRRHHRQLVTPIPQKLGHGGTRRCCNETDQACAGQFIG